ncbi:hypothetical protein [Curtobacterium sp. MCBD17_040]|uniref:hypothetical protein n=1 Tax=Curtobacterium sp. MCBD17_040 TaxID=2175674 RepID=UPI0011B4B3A0|nr:hypothetical protein [Curtobacterium sp. MCBD17_040]WIB65901.1 hypothetical protein DEI94_17450 [Curtobacterium sp. MCBD17_040]
MFAVFRQDEPVFVGIAAGAGGLRAATNLNLRTHGNLRASHLRRLVAAHELGHPVDGRDIQRPVIGGGELDRVNHYLDSCDIAWIPCNTAQQTRALGAHLLDAWRPVLNLDAK